MDTMQMINEMSEHADLPAQKDAQLHNRQSK
jgi:hypothetical protein